MLYPLQRQLDCVVVFRCAHSAAFAVRIASASMSTIGFVRIITRKSVRFAFGAVAISRPSVERTSTYMPVCHDLIATTSPSRGWNKLRGPPPPVVWYVAVRRSSATHATHASETTAQERPIADAMI